MPQASIQANRSTTIGAVLDDELVAMVPTGSEHAFAELWRRHHSSLVAEIRRVTSFDPEELAQEAFARAYVAINSGAKVASFRAYVGRIAKNLAIDWSRKWENCRTDSVCGGDLEMVLEPVADRTEWIADKSIVLSAYSQLPERYQQILWLKDIDDLTIDSCAAQLDVTTEGATSLLRRAREQFKQSWISSQLSVASSMNSECRQVVSRIPKYQRGKLTRAHETAVKRHLATCQPCDGISLEASSLAGKLSILVLICAGAGFAPTFLRSSKSERRQGHQSGRPPTAMTSGKAIGLVIAAGGVIIVGLSAYALATTEPMVPVSSVGQQAVQVTVKAEVNRPSSRAPSSEEAGQPPVTGITEWTPPSEVTAPPDGDHAGTPPPPSPESDQTGTPPPPVIPPCTYPHTPHYQGVIASPSRN